MACNKKRFDERKDAKKFIKERNATNKNMEGWRPLTSPYFCNQCDCYHVTSQPKFTREWYRNRKKS